MSDNLSIFISYAHAQSAFVDKLEAEIKLYGFSVWVDRSKIHAGHKWLKRIEDAINNCDVFVVVLSPQSVESQYVQMEYLQALKKHKTVIPLLSSSCEIPMILNNLQWADFRSSFEQGMGELRNALRHIVSINNYSISTLSHSSTQISSSQVHNNIPWGLPARQIKSGSTDSSWVLSPHVQHTSDLHSSSMHSDVKILQELSPNIVTDRVYWDIEKFLNNLRVLLILLILLGEVTFVVFIILAFQGRSPNLWAWVACAGSLCVCGFLIDYIDRNLSLIIEKFEEILIVIGLLFMVVGGSTLGICVDQAMQGHSPLWWIWLVAVIAIVLGIISITFSVLYDASGVQ